MMLYIGTRLEITDVLLGAFIASATEIVCGVRKLWKPEPSSGHHTYSALGSTCPSTAFC
jgi:hypothetical protein